MLLTKMFQNHNAVSHDCSFQPADLPSSSGYLTGNRSPDMMREVKCYIWWPANKIPSVIPLAVIIYFLIQYVVSHYVVYLYVKCKV